MKYSVGDKVRIREDLEHKFYSMIHNKKIQHMAIPEMINHSGKVVTICAENSYQGYKIDVCNYWWTDEMFEGLVAKENIMKDFKIINYKVYNEKTVIVWFDDGTQEKATCCGLDEFDIERGIEVCVMKHIFGEDKYKSMLKTAMKEIKAIDKAEADKKAEDELIARKKAKNAKRKERYRANRRARRIEEMKEAYVLAMEYVFNNIPDWNESFDDLK